MRLSARHARPPSPSCPASSSCPAPTGHLCHTERPLLSYRAKRVYLLPHAIRSAFGLSMTVPPPPRFGPISLRWRAERSASATFCRENAPVAAPLTYADQLPAPRSIRRFPHGANLLNISCLSKLTYSETDKSIPITHSVSITYLHARMYRPWRRFLDSLRSLGMTRECARNGLAPQNAGW